MTEDKINATEEYLNTAKYLHHLWQPEPELRDVKKMILMHKDAQEQLKKRHEEEEYKRKEIIKLFKDVKSGIRRRKSINFQNVNEEGTAMDIR